MKELSRSIFLFLVALISLPLIGVVFILKLPFYSRKQLTAYIKIAAIGIDQLGGSVLYGEENFTISSYTYYLCNYKHNKAACVFMRFINFFFGKDHCEAAYNWEIVHDATSLSGVSK